jgi:hypothetical protein
MNRHNSFAELHFLQAEGQGIRTLNRLPGT